MKNFLRKTIEYFFYLFVFSLSFQTKLILVPAETNYNEISLYLNYLLLALTLFLSFIYYFKYQEGDKIKIGPLIIILASWEFFIFISLFFSNNLSVSIFKYILILLSWGLFFLAINFKIFNIKKRKVIIVFLSALLIQASLALFQFFSQSSFSSKYLGMAQHNSASLGVAVIENDAGRFLRAYGASDHPNILGALMFFAFFFSLLLVLKAKTSRDRIVFFLFLLTFLLALIVSFSRAAYLALCLSLIFLLFFFISQKPRVFLKQYLKVLALLFVFILIFITILKPLLFSRFNLDSRLEQISLNERLEQSSSASDIIKENVFWGVGLGAYHSKLISLDSNLAPYEAQPVHNVFLLIWAEIGLWGFLVCVYLIFYLLKNNLNNLIYSPIFIGLFIFMIFDHWLWSLPAGLLFLFFFLSLTFVLKYDNV